MAETVSCPGCQTKLKLKPEYAGKKIKCPRCGTQIRIPAVAGVLASKPKAAKRSAPAAAPPRQMDEESAGVVTGPRKKKKGERADLSPCPECGEMVDNTATKCPHCKTPLEVDDEAEYKKWKPCPSCGAQKAMRVLWTIWGSFYFTALFKHVRCEECGKKYNGKTGKSNTIVATVCVMIPLLGIAAVVFFVWRYYKSLGY